MVNLMNHILIVGYLQSDKREIQVCNSLALFQVFVLMLYLQIEGHE